MGDVQNLIALNNVIGISKYDVVTPAAVSLNPFQHRPIECFDGEGILKSIEFLQELQEVNLSYLLLAQHMIREDRAEAMLRLGVDQHVAEVLAMLTPAQAIKLAKSSMLLCRFRFDDHMILSTLTHTGRHPEMNGMQAALLLAQQPVESIQ